MTVLLIAIALVLGIIAGVAPGIVNAIQDAEASVHQRIAALEQKLKERL